MHRVNGKNYLRIRSRGIAMVAVVVAVAAVVVNGSCFFDTKTNLCEASGRRCEPGQVCAADQDVCISIGGCGDGIVSVEKGEICDDGNIRNGDSCSSDCTTDSLCGNGVLDTGEDCDIGIGDSFGCDGDCTFVECGDGHQNSMAGEDCDTGPMNQNTAGCNGLLCKMSVCGDSFFNPAAGEMCDTGGDSQACNGNGNGNVGNDDRRYCQVSRCGDGYLNSKFSPLGPGTMLYEQCDDGNGANNDICPSGFGGHCQEARCGDDHVLEIGDATHPVEQCDDGATDLDGDGRANSNVLPDRCRVNCRNPSCGDGVTDLYGPDTADDEECDAGVNNSDMLPDRCRTSCRKPSCGDGVNDKKGSGSGDDETCDADPTVCGVMQICDNQTAAATCRCSI